MAFTMLLVLFSRPTTDSASLAISLSLIGPLTPAPPGDSASPPEVTHCSSVPLPPANTLVRWVNENAFASIVQARPYPTFGRPVHRRGSPHRLRPGTSPHALRIPPRDGHPALRSANLALRPASRYSRFWIWLPSSGRQRDFNPPEQCTAQRTLRPLLTSRSGSTPSPFQAQSEISPGKNALLHCTAAGFTPPTLGHKSFAVRCPLALSASPLIRFLSIGPQLRSTLPPHTRSPSCSCASLHSL
jgi:hypothetical protein